MLVLIPHVGRSVNGAQRWIGLGPVNLQPSELMKLFVVLYAADYTTRKLDDMGSFVRGFGPMAIVMVLVGFLLLKEPDFGAFVVILAIATGILFLGGINVRIFGGLVLLLAVSFVIMIWASPYRRSRISEFGVEDYFVKYYLPLLCKEIAKIPLEGNAWCVLSEDTTTGLPVAAALYSGWELPLGGPRAALVDDIVVLPEHRGRNIATDIQKFAYSALQKQEVKWVCGNIEKDNPASIRQSEKLGRQPWSASIIVKPN
jgi:GNAT superfamily N-acetyltransferase